MNARTFPVVTEADLYAMGMESPTAWHLMPQLCEALGVQFPPRNEDNTAKREALTDPLMGELQAL